MRNLIKSEFVKLFTVRSTYVVSILAILLIGLMSFYSAGWGNRGFDPSPYAFRDLFRYMAEPLSGFTSIIAILFIIHEYRYNIIMHTLTASNSRTKVLFAKLLVLIGYVVVFTLVCFGLGMLLYVMGAATGGQTMAPQIFSPVEMVSRALFYVLGSAILAFLIGVLIRNLAGAIVLILFGISAIEGLLQLILKENAIYLPIQSLTQVLYDHAVGLGGVEGMAKSLEPFTAGTLFTGYLLATGVATWYLFVKRDAN